MRNKTWTDSFIDTLNEKYPKKAQLTENLMNLLYLEREPVYRRLRQEVIFTIEEIAKISSAWNISLDKITGVQPGQIPFHMQPVNYFHPSEYEIKFLQHIIGTIHDLKNFSDAEFMDVSNQLPRQLRAGYRHLNHFFLFKWIYQYDNDQDTLRYSEVDSSEEMIQMTADYFEAIKNIPQSYFILDYFLFEHLTHSIQYFTSFEMITHGDKELIKNDLYALLDYMEKIAKNGCYPETQNKVDLYISQLDIDTNYSYTYTHQANICFVHVFDKYEIYTYNPEMVKNFKKWMHLKKRTSILISEVDKKSRIEYFSKQRRMVEKL